MTMVESFNNASIITLSNYKAIFLGSVSAQESLVKKSGMFMVMFTFHLFGHVNSV